MPHSERALELLRDLQRALEACAAAPPGGSAHADAGRAAPARAPEEQLRGLLPFLLGDHAARAEADRLLLVFRVNAQALARGDAGLPSAPTRAAVARRLADAAERHASAVGALGALAVLLGGEPHAGRAPRGAGSG